jgi:AraC family transcriptional regulator of adaptative response/methylated-DNA-[protein]-cysteine methyltransferase
VRSASTLVWREQCQTKARSMTDIGTLTAPQGSDNRTYNIVYGYGESSLGGFLAAVDDKGLCAVLFGPDRLRLREDLGAAFPKKAVAPCERPGSCAFVVNAVAYLIEQPAASIPIQISMRGGDFEHLVCAALRHTKPGTTVTPEEVAVMIGAAAESARYVRACATADLLAVVVPFHRLQEQDGTNPAYRWGEERRQTLLKREASSGAG